MINLRRAAALFILLAWSPSFRASAIPAGENWDLYPYPIFWGAGLYVEYGGVDFADGLNTFLLMGCSAAYIGSSYYRYPDGTPYDPPVGLLFLQSGFGSYDAVSLNWKFGIRQGLIFGPALGKNILEFFVQYRGRFKYNINNDSLMLISGLGDARGIFLNSIIPGLSLDMVRSNPAHNTRDGFKAETSLELAPSFFLNTLYGHADFFHYNLGLFYYITLFDSEPASEKNIFSIVLSGRSVYDHIFGSEIPALARQTIGGSSGMSACGGAVRGIQGGRFDGYIKLIQNIDLRLNFPTLWIFIPGLYVYFDAALFDDLGGNLSLEPERVMLTAGSGLAINFNFAELGLFANYFFKEDTFSLNFRLGMHY